MNYAHTMGGPFFAVGNAALKLLNVAVGGPKMLRTKLADVLDFSRLPADSSEFVMRMTRIGGDEAT